MSFTTEVKNEASKVQTTTTATIAQLSALISNSYKITNNTLVFQTENASVARTTFTQLKQILKRTPIVKTSTYKKQTKYLLVYKNSIEEIKKTLDISKVPSRYIIEDEEQKQAYLRGLFLATGSINNPKTSRYHFELTSDKEECAIFVKKLLNEFDLNSKVIKRRNKYVIYIKESEKIGDFLRIINTSRALFYFEDIRIYRDHKNMINRFNNCEQANIEKQINTAQEQISQIKLIENNIGIEKLEEKLQIIAKYRLKYPETSLQELSEIITLETDNKITKSGIYHRLNKIRVIALKIEKDD